MRNINEEEWNELIAEDENAVIMDCRTHMEWRVGVIENSIMLNINDPQSLWMRLMHWIKKRIIISIVEVALEVSKPVGLWKA